jgi:hypothetical protein
VILGRDGEDASELAKGEWPQRNLGHHWHPVGPIVSIADRHLHHGASLTLLGLQLGLLRRQSSSRSTEVGNKLNPTNKYVEIPKSSSI